MDFYANASLGPWTVNNELNRHVPVSRRRKNLKTEKLSSDNIGSTAKSDDSCGGQSRECCGKCHQENVQKLKNNETSQQ